METRKDLSKSPYLYLERQRPNFSFMSQVKNLTGVELNYIWYSPVVLYIKHAP